MTRDEERIGRIVEALERANLDAVVGTLPSDVLLLSGYWPVTGTALAVTTRDGQIGVLAPEDEQRLAARGWADVLHVFQPGSLTQMETLTEAVRSPLNALRDALSLRGGRIGYRRGPSAEASTYAAMHLYDAAILDLLGAVFPQAESVAADALLGILRGTKTPREVAQVRRACRIAGLAYAQGAPQLRAGLRETEAAEFFRAPLSVVGVGFEETIRAAGFVYCMAGSDSFQASGAYARSRANALRPGDLVLVHGNSYADGLWTDITRTFHLGPPDEHTQARYQAVLAARQAALDTIRPGVQAADVDRAARSVLEDAGLGPAFKHGTGHGVGFDAFNPNSLPRIHPLSSDVLEVGMVFNIEPAVYLEGWGGLRHCDMVTVTENGAELLTPFQASMEDLALVASG